MTGKRPILEHLVVKAWRKRLHPADHAEVRQQFAARGPGKDGHLAYFFYALACLDPSPLPEPTYAAQAGQQSWLSALIACYQLVQSDVMIQVALDLAGTATDLERLSSNPDMAQPWTLIDLSDYRALPASDRDSLTTVVNALCHLQSDRKWQLDKDRKGLETALTMKRLELAREYE